MLGLGVAAALGPGARADANLLARVMAGLAAVPARRDLFTETKTLAALSVPLESNGRLAWRRPDRLEKITDWPQPEVLVVHGETLSLGSGGGPAQRIDLAARPEIAALVEAIRGTLAGDLPGLHRDYHVAATGTEAAWRLVLVPRAQALAALVAEVAIDGAGDRLRRVRTLAANGDRTVMTIRPGQ